MENKKGRRNSILKTRTTTVDVLSETVDNGAGPSGPVTNRRVSFHNMKQIQEYDRHHGQMIEGTPIKEKITDTLGSDGILTPRGGNMENTNILEHDATFQVFNGAQKEHGAADMSLETTIGGNENNETARLFNVTRDKTVYYEEVIETTKTTKTVVKMFGATAGADDTMALFNQTNSEEVDMSMDQRQNDTMAMFNQTNPDGIDMDLDATRTFLVPSAPAPRAVGGGNDRTMNMDVVEEESRRANDTMNLFNMTNADNTDMDISQYPAPTTGPNDTISMFKSPAPPAAKKKSVFQHVDMDITGEEPVEPGSEAMDISQAPPPTPKVNDLRNVTLDMDITNEHHEEKTKETSRMDISAMKEEEETFSETMALFGSPARGKMPAPTTTATPNRGSKSPNETLQMFQSPARNEAKVPVSAQKTRIFDESMEIEESTLRPLDPAPEDAPEDAPDDVVTENSQNSESMVLEEKSVLEEERGATVVLQNSMIMDPREDMEVEMDQTIQKYLQMSMDISMDQSLQRTFQKTPKVHSDFQMSMLHRPKSVQDASTIHNESITLNVSQGAKTSESMMIKTMQISTDAADVTHTLQDTEQDDRTERDTERDEVTGEMDMEEDMEETLEEKEVSLRKKNDTTTSDTQEAEGESTKLQETFTTKFHVNQSIEDVTIQKNEEENHVDMSISMSSAILNQSCSMIRNSSRRRRSLLRDASIRESPRRVALENSMHISIHGGENGRMTALEEYRKNQSLLNATEQMNESGMNVSATSSSSNGARDIFVMNTSIRSPSAAKFAITNMNTPNAPSPISIPSAPSPGFQMPDYDPAVTNVVYLTSEDGEPLSEATEFQRLIMEEKKKVQKTLEQDSEIIEQNTVSKQDRQEIMKLAREEAEIKFLELRLQFAQEISRKQAAAIVSIESENSRIAESIKDAQSIEAEIATLRAYSPPVQYTREQAQEIREEYMKCRKMWFDRQMEALRHNYQLAVQIKEERAKLRIEMQEADERIARMEEETRKEREMILEELKDVMEQL